MYNQGLPDLTKIEYAHLNLNFQINNECNIWDMLMLNKLLVIDPNKAEVDFFFFWNSVAFSMIQRI